MALGVQRIDFLWPERHYLPEMSVVDNLLLENYWLSKHRYGVMNERWRSFVRLRYRQRHEDWEDERWDRLQPDQQRLLLYEKCLDQPCRLVLVSEPFSRTNETMMERIIEVLYQMAESGKALALFSMNFWNLRQVCDEIYLLRNGALVKRLTREEFDGYNIWGA